MKNTKVLSIYQIFVRDYAPDGTLQNVTDDLERIKSMGFDFVYLLPIHPISLTGRKGSIGSPYAIQDYDAVDEALGTKEDFARLIEKAHSLGLRVMMDIVIHHTGRDHRWVSEHPEYYHHDEEGHIINAVADWSDVYDLNYACEALREELIRMLCGWTRFGVDGFRCDVASLVPLDFWQDARHAVAEIKPDFVWLAESVEPGFVSYMRSRGLTGLGDGEVSTVYDLLYPYDIWSYMDDAFHGKNLDEFARMINFSLSQYAPGMTKIWCLENHDRPRIAAILKEAQEQSNIALLNWTAWSFLNYGAAFMYFGQEWKETNLPTLFEKEIISNPLSNENSEASAVVQTPGAAGISGASEFVAFVTKLNALKHEYHTDVRTVRHYENPQIMEFIESGAKDDYYGAFNVKALKGKLKVNLPDGEYRNLITSQTITVKDGTAGPDAFPMFIKLEHKCS